jgi:hypothetical protein
MKRRFLSSPVGRLHLPLSFFIAFNLLTGLVNLYIYYTPALAAVHFYTGLLIIAAPLITLLFMKDKKTVLKGFIFMALPHRRIWQDKKYALFFAHLAADIVFVLILVNMATGIMMKVDMPSSLAAYTIHTIDFNVLLGVIPLHVILMLIARSQAAHAAG